MSITHKRYHVKNAATYTQCPQYYIAKIILDNFFKRDQQKGILLTKIL